MHIVSALLLGLSTNLDNLFIGLSYGIQKRRITLLANLIVGLFSAAATCLFCYFSSLCSGFGKIPNYIGGSLIIFMGIFSLIAKEKEKKGDPPCFIIPMREAALLGAALAVNCIPVAFGAGLTGISPFAASVSVGLSSIATVYIGNKIGLIASPNINERVLSCIGGITLMLLGTLEMFI